MGDLTYEKWLQIGMEQGWCGPEMCESHHGIPLSESEHQEILLGLDPCILLVRLYMDEEHRNDVERYHEASDWRNVNGWHE